MKTQLEIETEWDIAKLLITNMNFKLLLYILPQYGLYVQSLIPVTTCYDGKSTKFPMRFEDEEKFDNTEMLFEDAKQPYIVTVRTEDTSRIADFISDYKEFRAFRIFKHGMYFHSLDKENVIGFVCETVKNMLNLYPGKTFYITSKNKELAKLFYGKAVEINEQDKLGCSFDYDEYDYTLEIRPYKRFKNGKLHRWAIVTVLYGEDLPNSWNIGHDGGEM